MEMNNGTKLSCPRGEEILAYLYGELPPQGRERFESHLQFCVDCTDEFAELAVSRYSVFEWRSVEFSPLATPKFVIPFDRKREASSWLDGIKAAFSWNGWVLAGGGAAVVIFMAIGFALWNVQPEATVARTEPEQVGASTPARTANVQLPVSSEIGIQPEAAQVDPDIQPKRERETVNQPSERKQTVSAKAPTNRRSIPRSSKPRPATASERLQNSPTLGQYVEDQDDGLRLSDIFDDLDTMEME